MKQPLIGSDSKSYLHGRVPKKPAPSARLAVAAAAVSRQCISESLAATVPPSVRLETRFDAAKNDADDMRVKLRAIFDKFDTTTDHSATELKQVIGNKDQGPPAESVG